LKGGVTVPSGNKSITCEKKHVAQKITDHYSSAQQNPEQIEKVSKILSAALESCQPDSKPIK